MESETDRSENRGGREGPCRPEGPHGPDGSHGERGFCGTHGPRDDLGDILDLAAAQSVLDCFSSLTGAACSIVDLSGRLLASSGTSRSCRCPHGLQDAAIPLYVGGGLRGKVHIGQFLREGEPLDEDFFAAQAARYGYDVEDYLAAARKIPRFSEEYAETLLCHLATIVEIISRLSVTTREPESSGRRRAEETLRLIRFAIDHAADGFYWLTPEGRFIDVNESACRRLGYTRDELLDMHVWDIAVGMGPEQRAELWEKAKRGRSLTFERAHRTKSGEVFPVEVTVNYVEHEGREVDFSHVRDISERKSAEVRTRELRDFYELILTRVNDGIWVTDENDRLIYFNPGMERIAGVAAQSVLGLDVTRDFAPETTEGLLEFYESAKRRGTPVPYETEVVTPAGRYTVQSGWLIPRVERGVYEGMICTIQDVTERRRAEDELRESEERYRRLFELESDAIMLADNETGRILEVNEAAVALYGYSREEWPSLCYTDMSAEPDESRKAVQSGRTHIPNRRHKKKDGAVFPAEVTITYLEWKGRPVHIAAIRDITGRLEAEMELRRMDEQLRQSQKMEAIGRLAGGIAHDFNNLLTAIIGYSDIVASEAAVADSPVAADVREIRLAAERAGALTRQILAFSRRQALQPALVSMNEIVRGMESLLRRTLGEDVSLAVVLDPDVGLTEVDVHQFEQVVMNLAVNARDAMPSGGRLVLETGNVEIDEHYAATHLDVESGSYVELLVEDTGLGMDAATLEKIFEPFFTTKAPGEGTGLGLSVVYGIVRQSGGSIEVQSEPGRGTRFRVRLPRVDRAPIEPVRPDGPAHGYTRGHETILVVEDDPALRGLVARVLRGAGYEVLVAADAGEALDVARERGDEIDLVVTDVVLPGSMQGDDLGRCLVDAYPGLPVLYMSGYTRDAVVHAGRLDDTVGFLQKPFSPAMLVEAVGRVLSDSPSCADGRVPRSLPAQPHS